MSSYLLALGIDLYLAAILGISGLLKLTCLSCFDNAMRNASVLPAQFRRVVRVSLPSIEIVLPVILIFGFVGGFVRLFTLTLFISFLVYKLLLYRHVGVRDCGCGSGRKLSRSVSLFVSSVYCALSGFSYYLHYVYAGSNQEPTIDLRVLFGILFTVTICLLFFRGYKQRQFNSRNTSYYRWPGVEAE